MGNTLEELIDFGVKASIITESVKEVVEAVENVNDYERQITDLESKLAKAESDNKNWAKIYNELLDRNVALLEKYEPETLDY